MSRIAYFITPHGYGHAARAAAVMAALLDAHPGVRFDIFTQVPAWFFRDSLGDSFAYHDLMTDVGMAQKTALSEDLPETVRRLDTLLPFDDALIGKLACLLNQSGCRLVMCDIAPMGIVVARAAGIPSVLVENFTWDWIYEGYVADEAGLRRYADFFGELFGAADYHIQTEPVGRPGPCDLTTAPVSRRARAPASAIRGDLGLPDAGQVVMVTMGGFSWQYDFMYALASQPGIRFVVPGGDQMSHGDCRGTKPDNVVLLPHHSPFFHPDLVNASDAVVGKVGYSTVAEVYWAGAAFGYVPRPQFRESDALVRFIQHEMQGMAISEAQFDDGSWVSLLPELLAMPRLSRVGMNGADQVAEFVNNILSGSGLMQSACGQDV
jgi:hypothetical protein